MEFQPRFGSGRENSQLARSLSHSLARSGLGDIDLKCADGRQEDVDLAPLTSPRPPTCFMRKLEMRCYVSE